MGEFNNKVAVVTGATGNLGRAVAKRFHQENVELVLVGRKVDDLKENYPQTGNRTSNSLIAQADLMDEKSVQNLITDVINHFGKIDVLIHTVGGFEAGKRLDQTALETWDFMMDLNARTYYLVSKHVIPHMMDRGSGSIVGVAARQGIKGIRKMAAYSASKATVIRVTESMAAELKNNGINVNCVVPSIIDTPQNRAAMPEADFNQWVKPDSIAAVIFFLASQAARDINGAALPVYGRV